MDVILWSMLMSLALALAATREWRHGIKFPLSDAPAAVTGAPFDPVTACGGIKTSAALGLLFAG
jgi:hypothetical protein